MGYALLLQWCGVLGLVLQLPLCAAYFWYGPSEHSTRHKTDIVCYIDLRNVDKMTFSFELGTPFKPFQQLMGVMPAASKELLPEAYRELMFDPNSPILDFYPMEFELDLNGKKAEWEAIVKIPFIDEVRLLKAMAGEFYMGSRFQFF